MSIPTIFQRVIVAAILLASSTVSVAAADSYIGPKGGDSRKYVTPNNFHEPLSPAYVNGNQALTIAAGTDSGKAFPRNDVSPSDIRDVSTGSVASSPGNGKAFPRSDVSATTIGNARMAAKVEQRDSIVPN